MTINIGPQWITKMYPSKVGRDHLGLGSVSSDQILPSLSPSINVLTYHPRYYSFYVFLLDEFWRQDRPRSAEAWEYFYRPRELIFSLGANLPAHKAECLEHGEMGKIVGASITQGLAFREQETYNTQTYYIKSSLGGYGLYYRSVMAELGIIYPGGRGLPYPVDVPSERGKKVAAAFRTAVNQTVYYQEYFEHDEIDIPIDVIRAYMAKACLCQLQHPATFDRPLMLDIFLHAGDNQAATARRSTFLLFLDIAKKTQGYTLTQEFFRQLIYFKSAENGVTYNPKESIVDTYKRWRLYQAREYYAFALNAMWDYFCYWGLINHGDVRPLHITSFWNHLDEALNFDLLVNNPSVPDFALTSASGFTSLLDWLQYAIGAKGPGSTFDAACNLQSPIQENYLYQLSLTDRNNPNKMIAGMITMLALIYLRFGDTDTWQQPEWEISRMGSNDRLSVHEFIQHLRRQLSIGPVTIGEITRWLYNNYIILQHQAIAAHKLPDNTFRFRREGSQLRFFNLQNTLSFMDSRFDALSTVVHELGLCGNLSEIDHPLTDDGEHLLREGDLL